MLSPATYIPLLIHLLNVLRVGTYLPMMILISLLLLFFNCGIGVPLDKVCIEMKLITLNEYR